MASKRGGQGAASAASGPADKKPFTVEMPLVDYGLLLDIANEYTLGVSTVARILLQYAIPRSPDAMGLPARAVLERHGVALPSRDNQDESKR